MHFAFDGHYLSYDVQFLDTKFKAIRAVKKGEKSKSQIATDFGVPANNLSTWLKNKESNIQTYQQLNPKRKTRKTSTEIMVEAARKKMLVTKAEELPENLTKQISRPPTDG